LNSGPKFAPETGQSKKYTNEVAIQIIWHPEKQVHHFIVRLCHGFSLRYIHKINFFPVKLFVFNNKPGERKRKINLEFKIDIHFSY
jgi:hypothetical protein